jgi:ribosomal protein S18 acetylase RimI-like enzyme
MSEEVMKNQEIVYREAELKDAEAINTVRGIGYLTTFVNPGKGITEEDILSKKFNDKENILKRQESIQNPDIIYLVAESDAEIVGFIMIKKENNELASFFVLPEFQRMGIGSTLFRKAFKYFKDGKIIVDAVEYSNISLSFYKKFGFELSREKPGEFNLPTGKSFPIVRLIANKKDVINL